MNTNYKTIAFRIALAAALAGAPFAALAKSDGSRSSHEPFFSQIGSRISGEFKGLGNAFGHLIAPGWAKHVAAKNEDGDADDNDNSGNNGTTTGATQSAPPVVTGLTAPTVLSVGQTGTWTVDAYDPQNGSLSYAVDWGDNAPQPLARIASQQVFVQSATFSHAYANPGDYRATFTVIDSAGLTAQTSATVRVLATVAAAPVISSVSATATSPTTATISWSTDVDANSQLWYSASSSSIGASSAPSVMRRGLVLNHRINLHGLAPSTTYYYVVGSANSDGALSTSSVASFVTLAATTTATTAAPLAISDAVAAVASTSVRATWITNEPADSEVFFGTSTPLVIGATSTQEVADSTLTTSHSVNVTGLAPNTTYYMVIQSKDASSTVQSTGQFSVTTGM